MQYVLNSLDFFLKRNSVIIFTDRTIICANNAHQSYVINQIVTLIIDYIFYCYIKKHVISIIRLKFFNELMGRLRIIENRLDIFVLWCVQTELMAKYAICWFKESKLFLFFREYQERITNLLILLSEHFSYFVKLLSWFSIRTKMIPIKVIYLIKFNVW